MAAGALIEMKW
jgi:quercetin dioxygenase-like cupin family protein